VCTLVIAVISVAVIGASILSKRQELEREREERAAFAAGG